MSHDNFVHLVGNCTRDPELRFLQNGQALANFGIAVNRRWQNRQTQEWEEAVSFFDVSAWGQLGENVCESIRKGNRISVTGRLEQRSWETPDGEKRSKIEVVADDVTPSLRWATAEIHRNERDSNGGGGRSRGSRSASSGGRGASRGRSLDDSYDKDEEPF